MWRYRVHYRGGTCVPHYWHARQSPRKMNAARGDLANGFLGKLRRFMFRLLGKFFDSNEKAIKRYMPKVDAINGLEEEMRAKSDEELRAMTDTFIGRLEDGETLDDILVDAFATVREASRRTLN